ncbi:hypothetical protein [Pseudonocardia sp. GCM10023141]|uniref:hypothetical protein n=1 Tax=Pseudonocardia sp. GCM10023141 TaxID=3252653 RepID=UPI00362132EF
MERRRVDSCAFRRRVVTIAPDDWHAFVDSEWDDSLVVVERGDIELYCSATVRRFAQGAMLWFSGLGLRALHNPGVEDTVLVALSRRC